MHIVLFKNGICEYIYNIFIVINHHPVDKNTSILEWMFLCEHCAYNKLTVGKTSTMFKGHKQQNHHEFYVYDFYKNKGILNYKNYAQRENITYNEFYSEWKPPRYRNTAYEELLISMRYIILLWFCIPFVNPNPNYLPWCI